MLALLSLILVITLSVLIVRIGAIALEMTGLSREVASFQAQSAFSGAGFTTSESEYVVSNPARRKIIRTLIFLGSAGITSAIATLVLTFVGRSSEETKSSLVILALSLIILYLTFTSKRLEKVMRRWIKRFLKRAFPELRVYDYNQLLGITKGYSISQIRVKAKSWLANKTLRELELNREGVIVLGIYRKIDGKEVYIGAPRGDTLIKPGDVLVCYGPEEDLLRLSKRLKGKRGDLEHEEAVREAEIRAIEEKLEEAEA
ncbi:TrkA C-terminal domain-containing protein [Thermococcus celer]|uniref:Potassium transporter TrkA n=1 Tax=Thermococcus celer Vu 13 = JCM 8558 TaxID=1293037 RepID=A0A218P303_THECE|nr:TrkA C-terminal domain-containing protein [Thermococcus celer]ASI99305.1 potassium transporter TrkA [Thermococcus celer Vu 13 = JCM 8558]